MVVGPFPAINFRQVIGDLSRITSHFWDKVNVDIAYFKIEKTIFIMTFCRVRDQKALFKSSRRKHGDYYY